MHISVQIMKYPMFQIVSYYGFCRYTAFTIYLGA